VPGEFGYHHPYITWALAPEPDVRNGGNIFVERRTRNFGNWTTWSQITQLPGSLTSYTDLSIGTAGYGTDLAEYRIRARDASWQYSPYSATVSIPISPAMFKIEAGSESKPVTFSLEQCHPNPFNPSTRIRYDLPEDAHVSLTVYDFLGREIATLVRHNQQAGKYDVVFGSSHLASGVYFYRLQAGEFVAAKKMILAR